MGESFLRRENSPVGEKLRKGFGASKLSEEKREKRLQLTWGGKGKGG